MAGSSGSRKNSFGLNFEPRRLLALAASAAAQPRRAAPPTGFRRTCLKSAQKKRSFRNMSSSDRFPLKPTGESKDCILIPFLAKWKLANAFPSRVTSEPPLCAGIVRTHMNDKGGQLFVVGKCPSNLQLPCRLTWLSGSNKCTNMAPANGTKD